MKRMINITNCNDCIHKEICMYRTEAIEAIEKINGHLSNIVASNDIFEVSFSCEKYSFASASPKSKFN